MRVEGSTRVAALSGTPHGPDDDVARVRHGVSRARLYRAWHVAPARPPHPVPWNLGTPSRATNGWRGAAAAPFPAPEALPRVSDSAGLAEDTDGSLVEAEILGPGGTACSAARQPRAWLLRHPEPGRWPQDSP